MHLFIGTKRRKIMFNLNEKLKELMAKFVGEKYQLCPVTVVARCGSCIGSCGNNCSGSCAGSCRGSCTGSCQRYNR